MTATSASWSWLAMFVSANWLVILLGTAALALAVALFVFGRRRPTLRYAVWGINLISDIDARVPSVELLYSGRKVSTVSVSKISLWNSGREAIRSGDLSARDPLRLVLANGAQLLAVTTLAQSNNAIGLKADTMDGGRSARLSFDFLNAYDGGVLQVVHDDSNPVNLWLQGSLVNASGPTRAAALTPKGLVAWFVCIGLAYLGVAYALKNLLPGAVFSTISTWIVLGWLAALVIPMVANDIRYVVPRKLRQSAWGFPGWRPR